MKEFEVKEKIARFDNQAKKIEVTVSKIVARKKSYIIKEDGQEIYHGEDNFIDIAAYLKDVMEKKGYQQYLETARIGSVYYLYDNIKLIIYEANKKYKEIEAVIVRNQKEETYKTYPATTSHPIIIDDVVKFLKIDVDANNHERYNNYQPEKP